MRAGRDAGKAAVAQVGIDKGWLAGIDLEDGLGAAHVAGQAFAAGLAAIIYDARYGGYLCFR